MFILNIFVVFYNCEVFILDTLNKILSILSTENKSQKELTDYLGIQKSAVTQWKLGKNTSYLKHISKIADFLGVSTDYLLGTEQKEKAPSQLSERANRILEAVNRLSVEEQEAFLLILEKKEKK